MRKLVTIRKVETVSPISGADFIQLAKVDGWSCVVKKDEFKSGDLCVYFEIDSFLPISDSRFSFLEKKAVKSYGVNYLGARIKTMRMKGQLSQGLILPVSLFPELAGSHLGDDVTDLLGIKKWEPTIHPSLAGEVVGSFPSNIPKTDQERCQNLLVEIAENRGNTFEVSMKLDGMSMTIYQDRSSDIPFGVCSRNLNLKENEGNLLWKMANTLKMREVMAFLGRDLAFQGELIGPGVNGNNEGINHHAFYVFDIFDINEQRYFTAEERIGLLEMLEENGFPIDHVPVLYTIELEHTVDELLEFAEGASLFAKEREGLVFKRADGKLSFKAISNKYLEKFGDR
jgi:RNA ligase (TIGR02306 family)